MTEQKHFNYEGHVEVNKPKKVEVKDVEFLTPARVKVNIDGREETWTVAVDIINRKVYDDKGESFLSEALFNHLDEINSLPEDFFAAPDHIYEKISEAEKELEKYNEENLGENNE